MDLAIEGPEPLPHPYEIIQNSVTGPMMDGNQIQPLTPSSDPPSRGIQPILSSIGPFPPELLIDIIFASGILDDKEENFGRLHDLARVCVRWWHIIKATPDFWVNVHSGDTDRVKLKIRRSGSLPISVFYHSTMPADTPEPEGCIHPFVEAVCPAADRWKRLVIDAPEAVDLFQPYLTGPTPLLSSIKLAGHTYRETIPVHLSSLSHLRSISLSHAVIFIPTAFTTFHSLRYLYITGHFTNGGESFLRILQGSNNLEELHFNTVGTGRNTDPPMTIISLPMLHTLRMEAMHRRVLGEVLQHLSTPALTALDITIRSSQVRYGFLSVPQLFGRTEQPPIPFQLLANVRFDQFNICVDQGGVTLEGVHDPTALRSDRASKLLIKSPVRHDWPFHLLFMATHLSKLSIPAQTNLRLTPSAPKLDDNPSPNFLFRLPNLIYLDFQCNEPRYLIQIIAFLSTLYISTSGSSTWVCPNLTRLSIAPFTTVLEEKGRKIEADGEKILPALLRMIRNRRAGAVPQMDDGLMSDLRGEMVPKEIRVYRMGPAGQEILNEDLGHFVLL